MVTAYLETVGTSIAFIAPIGIVRGNEIISRADALIDYILMRQLYVACQFPFVIKVLEQQFGTTILHIGQSRCLPRRVPIARGAW